MSVCVLFILVVWVFFSLSLFIMVNEAMVVSKWMNMCGKVSTTALSIACKMCEIISVVFDITANEKKKNTHTYSRTAPKAIYERNKAKRARYNKRKGEQEKKR